MVQSRHNLNECGNANGGCEHHCSNTLGSFTCMFMQQWGLC